MTLRSTVTLTRSSPSLFFFISKPSRLLSTTTSSSQPPPLTQSQLTQVNLLIPRLLFSPTSLPTAIRLLTTCLLHTSTPLHSLPLPILISHLTSFHPPSTSTSFLASLAPNPKLLMKVSSFLLTSYFKHRRPEDAMAVFRWMYRDGSCYDEEVGKAVLLGLCRCGKVLEAIRVLRDLMGSGSGVAKNVWKWVYWRLLREARVKEAREVEKVLGGLEEVGDGKEVKIVELLDRVVKDWKK